MSCEIKLKTLDYLKRKDVLGKAREVKDLTKFNEVNELLTSIADTKYMIKSPTGEKLFKTESKYVKNLDHSYRHLVRAIPNERLFEALQVALDEYNIKPIKFNNEVSLEGINTEILLKKIDLNELLDENEGEKLYVDNIQESVIKDTNNEQEGSINEFILFNNKEDKKTYDAVEILDNIITNFDGFSEHSDLFLERAKVLLASTKAKVKLIDKNDLLNKDTFMQYDPSTNTISLSLETLRQVSPNFAIHSFLHEVTHSVTVSAYFNPISVDQRLFKAAIDAAYKKYNTGYSGSTTFDSYGFLNPVEFIAEIYTNPSFIQEIKDRDKNENTNIWTKILDAIRSLFGLPKNATYEGLVDMITDITSTTQMNSRGQIFEKKSVPKEGEKFTKLQTISDKLDHTINKIEESLSRNIQSLKFTAKRTKNEKRTEIIEGYIKDFNKILEEVKEFRDTNQLSAVTTFLTKMASNVNHIKKRISNIDYSDKNDVSNVLGVYQDYLSTFAVINNIEDVVASIKTNLDTQDTITAEELEEIESTLKHSKGEYSFLEKNMYEVLKRGMATLLNDIKYFKNVEKEHRDRLSKEHKESKIPTNKEEWIVDKMQNRDKALIQNDLEQEIKKLIEDPSFDILGADVLFSSAINVSSPLIQIMNQILFDIKNDKNKIIQKDNVELNELFDKLSKEKNSTNPKELYKNILEFDSKGQPFFKSDFSIKFYEEVQVKLLGLYKDLREFKEKSKIELADIVNNTSKNSAEAVSKRKSIAKEVDKREALINKIKSENVTFNQFGIAEGPNLKWKNDLTKLSQTERDVLNLIHKRLERVHKDTFQQNPLVKFSFGTKFYELPRVTKTDLERFMLDGGKNIIKDKYTDLTEIRPDDIGYDATIRTDIENNRLFNLKVHYRDKSGKFNHKDQSLDVFNLIRLETENGTMFKIRKESELILKSLLDIAQNKEYYEKEGSKKLINFWSKKYNTVSGQNSNTYEMMNNIMEQKFYDIFNKSNIKVGKFDLNKTVKFINSSSAFLTLSLNLASGTANVLNANAQLFLESFLPMKGGFITASGIAKANRIYGSNLSSILSDITNPINSSFVNQIQEMFDITDSFNLTNSGFLKTNMVKAGFDKNSLQVFQSSGEHWIQSVTTMAVLDNIKALNKDGKFINKEGKVTTVKKAASLLDMLEINKVDGTLTMNKNVVYSTHSRLTKWNEGGKTNVDMLIRKKLYDTLGNYTELDQPEIMRHWGGKLMMLYRKYLIPMGQARFRGWESSIKDKDNLTEDEKRFSYALQENEEGTYTSLIRYLASTLRDHKYYLLSKPHWDRLTDYEKHNIKRATVEIVMTSVLLPLALMFVKGVADGEDDEYLFFLAYQLRRLDTELSQYRSITESLKMMKSPIPSARFIQSSISIFESAITPWTWGDEYESGPNKGESKNWTRFKKQIPVLKEFQRSYEGLLRYQESTWGSGQ